MIVNIYGDLTMCQSQYDELVKLSQSSQQFYDINNIFPLIF